MITIDLGVQEYYDETEKRFKTEKGGIVRFEYSLKVLYDWEARWRKPFLKREWTTEELKDFYKRMALDPVKDEFLTEEVMELLSNYIGDSPTATTFHSFDNGQNGNNQPSPGKIYTAEELYALMIQAQVPMDWENRNLNRLLVILRIISIQGEEPKKMSKQDIYKQNKEINKRNRERMKTKG